MTVDTIVDCAEDGMSPEEIAADYNVPIATVQALIDYAAKHRVPAAPAL